MSNRALLLRMKRLKNELKEVRMNPLDLADVYPEDQEMLRWNFIIYGPPDSDYYGGEFFGRIVLPPEYPSKPPDFYMLTPSGRFAINRKICLSNSSYHSNEWSPVWSLRSILVGLISIMLDDYENGISHIHESSASKKAHARKSIEFNQKTHPEIYAKIKEVEAFREKVFALKAKKKAEEEAQKKDDEAQTEGDEAQKKAESSDEGSFVSGSPESSDSSEKTPPKTRKARKKKIAVK